MSCPKYNENEPWGRKYKKVDLESQWYKYAILRFHIIPIGSQWVIKHSNIFAFLSILVSSNIAIIIIHIYSLRVKRETPIT